MHLLISRLPVVLLGGLVGLISQLSWLIGHGWEEAGLRIPAGLVGGALVLWLLGEGLAWVLRRMGRDFWAGSARVGVFLERRGLWQGLATAWLALLLGFGVGLYVYATKSWPYPMVDQVEAWLEGEGQATLSEKLANDLDITPARHLVAAKYHPPAERRFQDLNGLPLRARRDAPRVFLAPAAPRALRAIYGAFDFKDKRYGVVLLGPEGKVRHVWKVSQEDVDWEHRDDANVFPHGFVVDRQGSIYVGYDNGSCLTKYDWCSRIVWRLRGHYHHAISLGDDNTLWVWGPTPGQADSSQCILQIDRATGKILQALPLAKLRAANPEIDIFGIRQMDRTTHSIWVHDGGGPWHPNDVEPLLRAKAAKFPQFKAGDLVASLRSINLVLVIDPVTAKVKWWRQGMTRRQHDPDWAPDGTISIFDNNTHRDWSRIVAVDPKTSERRVLLDGRLYGFYSHIQGKHQHLPGGGLLITSPQQGRVFEVDRQGKVVFELLNVYDDEDQLLNLSEAISLPLDYFRDTPKCP
ncbi:MAG: arylsulfotransferase family protein [Deltaproteobacteria bacterium]|nr:arylsulfotransferase family protein [Deltaproteobacteria bacterium]